MKKVFLIFILMVVGLAFLIPTTTIAQKSQRTNPATIPNHFYWPLWTAKTYVISQKDTSANWGVAGNNLIEIATTYDDSASDILRVEYRPSTSQNWTWVAGDTVTPAIQYATQPGATGSLTISTKRELVLRASTVDKFPGMAGQIRVIHVFQASLCGVTTPTYSTSIVFKP
jgi:hypothetical protein